MEYIIKIDEVNNTLDIIASTIGEYLNEKE